MCLGILTWSCCRGWACSSQMSLLVQSYWSFKEASKITFAKSWGASRRPWPRARASRAPPRSPLRAKILAPKMIATALALMVISVAIKWKISANCNALKKQRLKSISYLGQWEPKRTKLGEPSWWNVGMFCKMMSFYSARYATRGRQKQLESLVCKQRTNNLRATFYLCTAPSLFGIRHSSSPFYRNILSMNVWFFVGWYAFIYSCILNMKFSIFRKEVLLGTRRKLYESAIGAFLI